MNNAHLRNAFDSSRILAIINDPGACSMLVPVFKKLQDLEPSRFFLKASSIVAPKLLEAKIKFETFDRSSHYQSSSDQDIVKKWFQDLKPEILVTGTSWGSQIEQIARNLAAEKKIRSVTVIDYWSGYQERWPGLAPFELSQIQDLVCVVDEVMKQELVQTGLPEKNIHITGHPGLEEISQRRTETLQKKAAAIKKILFLSEPLRDPQSVSARPQALTSFIKLIQTQAEKFQVHCEMIVKFHPKEDPVLPPEFSPDALRSEESRLTVCTYSMTHNSFLDTLSDFDLVAGYHTMGLLEAALSGCPAVSVPVRSPNAGVTHAFKKAGLFILDRNKTQPEMLQNSFQLWREKSLQTPKDLYIGSLDSILSLILK